ncbi:MAG: RsbT co-antagonist protein RsbR [Polaromonas sp.]|nr:RsbT co-antagonist protein RsbR [Polaromonas sp.]
MDKIGTGSILKSDEAAILRGWINTQLTQANASELLSESEVKEQSKSFMALFIQAAQHSFDEELEGEPWDDVRAGLVNLSKRRAVAGFSPAETATFVFSLKKPLFDALRRAYVDDPKRLNEETWLTSTVLDKLGLLTVDAFQQGREQVILRQQQELLDLSTPVIKLWQGIVAVPLIGTLDSERTQVIMESLLDAIVEYEANVAIIDITGVPTVDTLVAQHLLKAVAAARLMGAECIISGIRPQIAQTIVHLGVDLGDVITKSTLADALRIALAKCDLSIGKTGRQLAAGA